MFLWFGLTFIAAFQLSSSSECPPHACLESQTCCAGTDASEYGCCAIPEAICCPSGNYCCPRGSSCDESQSTCVLNEPDNDPFGDFSEDSVTAEAQPFSKRLGDLPEFAEETSVEAANFCDDQNYCAELMTCCPTIEGGHSCCPFEDAVCCHGTDHCCPGGQECDASSGLCIEETDPAKLVKHINLPLNGLKV